MAASDHVKSSFERISVNNVGSLLAGSSSHFITGASRSSGMNGSSSNQRHQNGSSDVAGGLLCHKLYEDMVHKYKEIAEQSQQELAAAQFRIKSLETEVSDLAAKHEGVEQFRATSRSAQSSLEEKLHKQTALVSSLQNSYADLEEKYKLIETAYHEQKIELTSALNSLEERSVQLRNSEEQNIVCQEHIAKLESSISDYSKLIKEMYIVATGRDGDGEKLTDLLIEVKAAIEDHAGYKEKYETLRNTMDGLEQENNAGRATILRLVGELEAEKAKCTSLEKDKASVASERDSAASENAKLSRNVRNLEKELQLMQQKLQDKDVALEKQLSMMQVQITSARHEVLDAKNAQTDLESSHQMTLSQLKIDLERFRNELSQVFKTHDMDVDCWNSTAIVNAVQDLLVRLRDTILGKQQVEWELSAFQENSRSELAKYELMYKCASLAEEKLKTNSEHIAELESRITFTQADIEELAALKEKFNNFITKLSSVLKLESILSEVGLDLNVEAITQRVQKLADREDATLIEKTSIIRRLEKTNRTLKDQLESKELHLDMLRKKLENADEQHPGGLHYVSSQLRSVEKHNEVLTCQLKEAKVKIMELKSILQTVRDVKLRIVEGGDMGNAVDVNWGSEVGNEDADAQGQTVESVVEKANKSTSSEKEKKSKKQQDSYLRVSSAKINKR